MKMTVDLKEHSYPIYIERGILKEAAERIAEVYQGSKIMIISDDRVYSYYGEALKKNRDPAPQLRFPGVLRDR